jgi:hypothetical protein
MNAARPILDPNTHYRIEVQGQLDVEWLQTFDRSVQILSDETRQTEEITVLSVQTDQAGIVGLVRKLHGLGTTILQVRLMTREKE